MKREHTWTGDSGEYTLAAEASAEVIPIEGWAGGSVETGAALTIAVYASNDKNATKATTFKQAYDEDGVAVQIVASAAGVWNMPSAVFSYPKIKLVYASGGTVNVFLKA